MGYYELLCGPFDGGVLEGLFNGVAGRESARLDLDLRVSQQARKEVELRLLPILHTIPLSEVPSRFPHATWLAIINAALFLSLAMAIPVYCI